MVEIQIIDNSTRPAGDELLESLQWASHVRIATAFAKGTAVSKLLDSFKRVLTAGGELQVVYGLDFHITDPEALEQFIRLSDDYPTTVTHRAYSEWGLALRHTFHPKLYVCADTVGNAHVLAGSSNLTQGGLWSNFEVNIVVRGVLDDPVIVDAYNIFERAVTYKDSFTPTQEYVDSYRELYRRAASFPVTPNPPDRLAAAYEELRRLGNRQPRADCPRHAGHENSGNRVRMEEMMARLPENQGGAGRHKCPYCAFEQAYWQAMEDVQTSRVAGWTPDIARPSEWPADGACPSHAGYQGGGNRGQLEERMAHLPENQAGAGRHKCAYCAYQRGYWQAIDELRRI